MATAVVTGRSITLTINSVAYTDQITSCVLTPTDNPVTGIVVSGPYAARGTASWTLDVEMIADWGATSSVCEALWSAAETGTALSFTLLAATGASFAGSVVPMFPQVGGPADGAQTVSVSMPVNGTITETFS